MKLNKIICLGFSLFLLLLIFTFRYTVTSDPERGERTVTYGIPNIYQVSYVDVATGGDVASVYDGIPTLGKIASYKFGAASVVVVLGALGCVLL